MNLKKKVIFIILSVLIVTAISGCNGGNNSENGHDIELPTATVEQFWGLYSAGDMENAARHVSANLQERVLSDAPDKFDTPVDRAVRRALLNSFSLEITGHLIEGDQAVVTSVYSHPDFDYFYSQEQVIEIYNDPDIKDSDESVIISLIEEVLSDTPVILAEDFKFELSLIDDQWVITSLPPIDFL